MSQLDITLLKGLRGTALFYPGTGNDWKEPIELFVPYITEFWFVDIVISVCLLF